DPARRVKDPPPQTTRRRLRPGQAGQRPASTNNTPAPSIRLRRVKDPPPQAARWRLRSDSGGSKTRLHKQHAGAFDPTVLQVLQGVIGVIQLVGLNFGSDSRFCS